MEQKLLLCLHSEIKLLSSVATELEIGELSRAELSWIFPSRAELADFQKRAELSWMFF